MYLLTNGIEYKLISEIVRLDKNNPAASTFPLGPLSPHVRSLTHSRPPGLEEVYIERQRGQTATWLVPSSPSPPSWSDSHNSGTVLYDDPSL